MTNPFHFSNGQSAANTQELQAVLEQIDSKEVQQHITEGHFADWIRYELGNNKLADRIAQCRSAQQIIDVLHLEHTPKPRPTIPKPAQNTREPIRDLQRPSSSIQDVPTLQQEIITKNIPEAPAEKPQKPQPLPKQGVLERYNAKEFVIGLSIGIVLGVLLYALVGAI